MIRSPDRTDWEGNPDQKSIKEEYNRLFKCIFLFELEKYEYLVKDALKKAGPTDLSDNLLQVIQRFLVMDVQAEIRALKSVLCD